VRDWVLAFNAEGPCGLMNGAGQLAASQRRAPAGIGADRRERPDTSGSRRGPLAADRSGAMAVRGVPYHDQQADAQPRIARPRLPQAVGTAPAPRPRRRGPGGVQKNSPPASTRSPGARRRASRWRSGFRCYGDGHCPRGCSNWQASATRSGSPPPCRPKAPSISPLNQRLVLAHRRTPARRRKVTAAPR
jgi:hypothetical protein